MLLRLLCAHEMTKHVRKISHLNSKRLLRKLQKMLGATLFCRTLYITHNDNPVGQSVIKICDCITAPKEQY